MIPNLPISFTDKINSAALLAVMSSLPANSYLSAEDINKFKNAINELHERSLANPLYKGFINLSSPAPSVDGVYVPTVSGTYIEYGNIVVDLAVGYTTISVSGSSFGKQVNPIDLSLYAKKTDTVDNLTSTSVTGALSSNQGRILKLGQDLKANITDVLGKYAKTLGLDEVVINNDFSSNLTEFAGWNGGVISLDSGRLKVVASTSAKGVYIKPEFIEDLKPHILIFDIDLGTVAYVKFYNKWANLIKTITVSGTYSIPFTSDNSGVFPYPIIAPEQAGTFYIDNVRVFKTNLNKLYSSYSDIENIDAEIVSLKNQLPIVVLDKNFETEIGTGLTSWNGGAISLDSGRLKVVCSDAVKGVAFNTLLNNQVYEIEFQVDLGTCTFVEFRNYWTGDFLKTITTNGVYKFTFTNKEIGGLPYSLIKGGDAGTFYLEYLKIKTNIPWSSAGDLEAIRLLSDYTGGNYDSRVKLGKDATTTLDKQVVIGGLAKTNQIEAVVVGYKADGDHVGYWGCQNSNEHVTIGSESNGGGWRTTAIGSKAIALGQSSCSFGAGTETTVTHGLALGRGAMMDWFQNGIALGGIGARKLYIGTSWAHRFRAPLSGISMGQNQPITDKITVSGINAFDFRPYQYSAVVTYLKYEEVVYNGQLYLSLINSNLGNTPPTLVNANWQNITSLIIGHTEYYPRVSPLIYVSPVLAWASNKTQPLGRVVSDTGLYYIRKTKTDDITAPATNVDYVDISFNWNGTRLECGYLKAHNPKNYSTGEMTVKWESIFVSKTNSNTTIPPKNRVDDANWHCIYDSTASMTSWFIGMDGVTSYDTRHDFNVIGGDIDIDGGMGTGTNKSGKVNIRTKKAGSLGENTQQTLEIAGQFHSETGTDTRFKLLDNATGTLKDVKYYLDGSNRKILYID
jgi:hypothetical protein